VLSSRLQNNHRGNSDIYQRTPDLTTQASATKPQQSDAIGIAFVLLSGLGVIFLPTTAKFAYLDGSNVLTVAFVRGLVGVGLLMFEKLSHPAT